VGGKKGGKFGRETLDASTNVGGVPVVPDFMMIIAGIGKSSSACLERGAGLSCLSEEGKKKSRERILDFPSE